MEALTPIRYELMRPDQLARAREMASLVYVPIGSIEYHGFHLPVGFDTLNAYHVCLRAAQQTGGVVLPPTYWGTRGHEGFPGSLLLAEQTVATLAGNIMTALARQGYSLIVFLTGHWGSVQGALIRSVARAHMPALPGVDVLVTDVFGLDATGREEHAGLWETSIALHLFGDLTDMPALQSPGALEAIAPNCVDATAEQGKLFFDAMVVGLVNLVAKAL